MSYKVRTISRKEESPDDAVTTAPLTNSWAGPSSQESQDGRVITESGRELICCFKCKKLKAPKEIAFSFEARQFGYVGRGLPICFECLDIFRLEYLHRYAQSLWTEEAARERAA